MTKKTSDFSAQFLTLQNQVQDVLEKSSPTTTSDNLTAQAASYSLLLPGKRLRPILAAQIYQCISARKPNSAVWQICAALEYVHVFSLIHDDLPDLDNDDLRRGQPTCHRQFNPATAILAGDLLLAQAFQLIATAPLKPPIQGQHMTIALTSVLSQAVSQLIQGEQTDLLGEKKPLSKKELEQMYRQKTGALFSACFAFGAILAEYDNYQDLAQLGSDLGLAFQIQDDILNLTGDPTTLGKATNTDITLHKSTYPALTNLDQATATYQEIYQNLAQELPHYCPILDFAPPGPNDHFTYPTPNLIARDFLLDLLKFLQTRQK